MKAVRRLATFAVLSLLVAGLETTPASAARSPGRSSSAGTARAGATSAARTTRRSAGKRRHAGSRQKRVSRKARPSSGPPLRRGLPELTREAAENLAPRGETELERTLQDGLGEILRQRWLKSSVNGVYVMDLASGRELFAVGADRQLNPASNVKLVATATALDVLGGEFTYRSRLLGPAPDADGVIHGDLYYVGASDPMLKVTDLDELARQLLAAGVRQVTGDVVVGASGLRDTLGRSTVAVTVSGGRAQGDRPWVSIHPDSGYFVVENTASTVRKLRRPRLSVSLRTVTRGGHERIAVSVGGKLRAGQVVRFARVVPGPTLFLANTLHASLVLSGIDVRGGVRREAEVAAGAIELAAHESPPLATIVARVNKPSNNFLADRVSWTAGAEALGGEAINAKGVRAMESWLARIGIVPGTYRLDNGSGLSYTNHLSARQVASVLLAGLRDFRISADFLSSLAIGGRDGTLRGRFRGHPSEGRVRGKTGTLTGVSALSGFVSAGGERTLVFSILTNGFPKRRLAAIRAYHVDMVDEMYRYLERKAAAEGALLENGALPPDPSDEPAVDGEGGPPDETEEILVDPAVSPAPAAQPAAPSP